MADEDVGKVDADAVAAQGVDMEDVDVVQAMGAVLGAELVLVPVVDLDEALDAESVLVPGEVQVLVLGAVPDAETDGVQALDLDEALGAVLGVDLVPVVVQNVVGVQRHHRGRD